MKKIKVEIPLDEAVAAIGVLDDTVEFVEGKCKRNKALYHKTGVMMSVKDRIFSATMDQATKSDIENIDNRG